MRTTALVSLIGLLAACAATDEQSAEVEGQPCGSPLVLTGEGIGEFRVGAPVDSIRAKCDVISETSLTQGAEGMPERRIAVRIGRDTVEATVDSNRVWRIELRSPRFRTADSLGIGSTVGEMRKQPVKYLGYGEGGPFVTFPRHCGLSFGVDDRGVFARELAKLPDNATVDLVLIMGCR